MTSCRPTDSRPSPPPVQLQGSSVAFVAPRQLRARVEPVPRLHKGTTDNARQPESPEQNGCPPPGRLSRDVRIFHAPAVCSAVSANLSEAASCLCLLSRAMLTARLFSFF